MRTLAPAVRAPRRRPTMDAGSRCARRQPTSATRLAAGTTRLRPQDWKSGDRLQVVEVIAPFGGAEEMVRDLEAKMFPQQQMKCLALSTQGREVRVV